MTNTEPLHLDSLTIFFPFYNEVDHVEALAASAIEVGRRFTDDLEVILVDDGSSDGTAELIDRLAAEHRDIIRAVHNETNGGYGSALKLGFRSATKDWIFYTDGDGQFDLNELDRVIALASEERVVSPYRVNRKDTTLRKLNGWLWGRLMRVMFGLRIKDIDCAFKLYPKALIDQIELKSDGALIDTEMLARAERQGYDIVQTGVTHYPRKSGESTGGNLRVIIRAFKEAWTLRESIRRS